MVVRVDICIKEGLDIVGESVLEKHFADVISDKMEVVPGHPWEEMVRKLELKSSMEPVEVGRVGDIHGGAELEFDEVEFFRVMVVALESFHSEVGKCDLDMENTSDRVTDEEAEEENGVVESLGEENFHPEEE